jgi:hypothetical protein
MFALEEEARGTGKGCLDAIVPGDVGGLANGAELIECAPRLCVVRIAAVGGGGARCRVLVKVMRTEKGSPAKKDDWVGVIETRMGVSASSEGSDDVDVRRDMGSSFDY